MGTDVPGNGPVYGTDASLTAMSWLRTILPLFHLHDLPGCTLSDNMVLVFFGKNCDSPTLGPWLQYSVLAMLTQQVKMGLSHVVLHFGNLTSEKK